MTTSGARQGVYWDRLDVTESVRWVFAGEAGLERLSGHRRFTAEPAHEFVAALTRRQFGEVAVDRFEATSFHGERGPEQLASHPEPVVMVMVVLRGSLHVRLADCDFWVDAGQHVVIDERDAVAYRADEPVEILRCAVGVAQLPNARHRRSATVPGPVGRSRRIDSFAAFLEAVLSAPSACGSAPAWSERTVAVVAHLQSTVLHEAEQRVQYPDGPIGLRYRIEAHIEDHCTDASLDVAAIAAALGVSIRHAHGVYDQGDRTIARAIADRRAAGVAEELRSAPASVLVTDLARRHGFASTDRLNRAFRHLYGASVTEYHARYRRG